jgi:hypothetical protein
MSNERKDELERMWKETVMAKFMKLYRPLPEMTEGNHGKPQSE